MTTDPVVDSSRTEINQSARDCTIQTLLQSTESPLPDDTSPPEPALGLSDKFDDVASNNDTAATGEAEGVDWVIRCLCGDNWDDVGYMLACELCQVWQHGPCVGVTAKEEPDAYYCELCRPDAPIHVRRRNTLQTARQMQRCRPCKRMRTKESEHVDGPLDIKRVKEAKELPHRLLNLASFIQHPCPELVISILSHRRGAKKTWIVADPTIADEEKENMEPDAFFEAQDTHSICEGYDQEGYTSMNTDLLRNRLYDRAIRSAGAQVPVSNTKHVQEGFLASPAAAPDTKRQISPKYANFKNVSAKHRPLWIEIGCGSSALLTRMVLKHHGQCLAIEVNPKSAATAEKVLREFSAKESNWKVIHGASSEKHVTRQIKRMIKRTNADKDSPSFARDLCVLHEIFGYFASSEGAPLALHQFRSVFSKDPKRSPTFRFVPCKAGTFFTPVHLLPATLDNSNLLYVTHKLILAQRLDIASIRLSVTLMTVRSFSSPYHARPWKYSSIISHSDAHSKISY